MLIVKKNGELLFCCIFEKAVPIHIGTGVVATEDVNRLAALSAGAFGFVTAVFPALTGLSEAEEMEGKFNIGLTAWESDWHVQFPGCFIVKQWLL